MEVSSMERRRRSVTSATEIETPYNAYSLTAEGITGGRNLLWVLYSLSISDKHRVIPVWGSSALLGMFHLPRTSSHAEFRKSIRSRTSPNGPFKHGHKVQSFSFPEGRDANPADYVTPEFTFEIAFDRGGPAQGLTVLWTLSEIAMRVRGILLS